MTLDDVILVRIDRGRGRRFCAVHVTTTGQKVGEIAGVQATDEQIELLIQAKEEANDRDDDERGLSPRD